MSIIYVYISNKALSSLIREVEHSCISGTSTGDIFDFFKGKRVDSFMVESSTMKGFFHPSPAGFCLSLAKNTLFCPLFCKYTENS